jgi:SAM-dependent methyltransferase
MNSPATGFRAKLKRVGPHVRFFLQRFNLAEAWERYRYGRRHGVALAIPPRRLRVLVGPDPSIERFLEQGRRTTEEIRLTLESLERPLEQFSSVLDFGCGCGRQMRWMAELANGRRLHGTDICADAVRWNQRHLPFARFTRNGPAPPLPFDDATFGLVYALSVFTHLSEPAQRAWLAELRRVTLPGGVLLLTTHGDLAFEQFRSGALPASAELLARLQRHTDLAGPGMVFEPYEPGGKYGLAFHDEAYVRAHWQEGLRLLKFIPRGGDGWQDIVVLEKPRKKDSRP